MLTEHVMSHMKPSLCRCLAFSNFSIVLNSHADEILRVP